MMFALKGFILKSLKGNSKMQKESDIKFAKVESFKTEILGYHCLKRSIDALWNLTEVKRNYY